MKGVFSLNRKYEPVNAGDTINDMTVMYIFRDTKNNRRMVHCRCNKCGREKELGENLFRKGEGGTFHETGCCFGIKGNAEEKKFKDIWAHMNQRINNPNCVDYNNYGGRGLTSDYPVYMDFKDEYYLKYLEAKTMHPGQRISIDRIDNNLGYIRGNIRFTTPVHQTRNSRMVRKFIAIAPNGQVYLTNNQLQFGINHGLESRHISDCLRGKQATTAGWRFYEIDELFRYQYEDDPTVIKELYY